jgi:hypothetical protein
VDDSGIKYNGKEHADHLLKVLRGHYSVEVDWNGALYCGITLNWNYTDRYVDIFWYALRPTDILTVILVAMDVFETYLAIDVTLGPSN